MEFRVIPNSGSVPTEGREVGYLWTDNWDDWFEFNTLYVLTYFDASGTRHGFGGVKIGQVGMEKKQKRPVLPATFESLDSRFFSLGQDVEYYDKMRKLPAGKGHTILAALNDIVADEGLYARAKSERVTGVSLMRSVKELTLLGQFRRVLHGGARLTSYSFKYQGPAQLEASFDPVVMSFSVEPYSAPPSNVHVIIGRNGSGKSFLLNSMSRALVNPDENVEANGKFTDESETLSDKLESPFANVVSVTFSAFDEFPIIRRSRSALKGAQYTNIGLRTLSSKEDKTSRGAPITATGQPADLTKDFIQSAKACSIGEKRERWVRALRMLESDPNFEEASVADLLDIDSDQFGREAGRLFRRFSSGHKIVLLTITRLVEKVEERTLVLMDEPEAHLHPPLLSAFVRALSDLLINRNGVAIVATHSPVVLQEVPRESVWMLRRHGGGAVVERSRIETFGEHVGHLTYEAFGLEVRASGFYRLIADMIEPGDTFEAVNMKPSGHVGSEGRALISALLAPQDGEDQ